MNSKDGLLKFKKQYSKITLEEFENNYDELKEEYEKVKTPPYYQLTKLREWKNWIYESDEVTYKKDKMWEALNDDITKEELHIFILGTKGIKWGLDNQKNE